MTAIGVVLTAVGVIGFLYTYGGYALLLRALSALFGRDPKAGDAGLLPGVTVFISMLNEEDTVESRLANLVEQDFPADRLEILVLSDGSTDATAERARAFADDHPDFDIRVVEQVENLGKAQMQNLAVRLARFDVLLSTDAETLFAPSCVRELALALTDPGVAVAGGRLIFHEGDSALGGGQAMYRRMEHRIRTGEDSLRVMTRADAVCMAFRRDIWEQLEDFEDADQVLTLIARKKGYIARHVGAAVCFDQPNTRRGQEVRARTRMTKKTLFGLEKHWGPGQWLRHPGFTWALFSHKIVRLLSPFFLSSIVMGLALLIEAQRSGFGLAFLFVTAVAVAVMVRLPAPRQRVLGLAQALLIANLGFASGWLAYLRRDRVGRWVPSRRVAD